MERQQLPPDRPGELELIRRIRNAATGRNGAVKLGIGDDCAVLRVAAGDELVVTTDLCLEGRHFRRDWHSPRSVGHRCLARGLSDIAAMGGRPVAAFLSLALPRGYDLPWLDGFLHGFNALAERFGVELAGGDTSEAPGAEILADVMVLGTVLQGQALRRGGARPGDEIYVTGNLGGAAVELEKMRAGAVRGERGPQSFPEPRVEVGLELARLASRDTRLGFASSCMDLSDGLSTDLRHLCEASRAGAEITALALPLAPGATLDQALHGGEDYELLFTAPRGVRVPAEIAGVRVTRIGMMEAAAGVRMDGQELAAGGWEHLK